MGTATKGLIAKEDLKLYDGSNSTFTRKTSSGGTATYSSIDWVGVDVAKENGLSAVAGVYSGDVSINSSLKAIGSSKAELFLAVGTWTLDDDLTIPANVFLKMPPGATVRPAAGKTLTVYSPENIIASPRQQIVDSSNNSTDPLLFTVGGIVYPGWWGDLTSTALNLAFASLLGLGGEVHCSTGIYDISTSVVASKKVNLRGTHSPNPRYPSDEAHEGTVLNRSADVALFEMIGTNRSSDRLGLSTITGIAFESDVDISSEAVIDAKYADHIIFEKCSFTDDINSTTVGHMVNAEECWDWTFRDCLWKHYGNSGGTKHGVRLYNGDDNNCNSFRFDNCFFYSGNGYTIVSDVTGGGSAVNSLVYLDKCKFEDVHEIAKAFIYGLFSNLTVDNCMMIGANEAFINIPAQGSNYYLTNNSLSYSGSSATEFITMTTPQHIFINGNKFLAGAAMTAFIELAGAWSQDVNINDNAFDETTPGTTPIMTIAGSSNEGISVEDNGIFQNETVTTGSPTLMRWPGHTKLDSSGGAITATQGSGLRIGDSRIIVMTNATTSSTVSVTNHVTSDPYVGTFDDVDETWVLMWAGTEWVTIYATCTFV